MLQNRAMLGWFGSLRGAVTVCRHICIFNRKLDKLKQAGFHSWLPFLCVDLSLSSVGNDDFLYPVSLASSAASELSLDVVVLLNKIK